MCRCISLHRRRPPPPRPSPPAVATRWRVAPHARAEIILLQFQSHTSGQYDGQVHIKTNFDDIVIPVELGVMRGGLTPSVPMVIFFGFTSDRVRCVVMAVSCLV
jgi:hypothetical protein